MYLSTSDLSDYSKNSKFCKYIFDYSVQNLSQKVNEVQALNIIETFYKTNLTLSRMLISFYT